MAQKPIRYEQGRARGTNQAKCVVTYYRKDKERKKRLGKRRIKRKD